MAFRPQRFNTRQSMANKEFEVFHYRDKTPKAIGVHHHDFYELYLFLSGKVDFRVEGKTYHPEPGDLLLINPWELHQAIPQPGAPYERMVLWIDRGYLDGLSGETINLAACFDSDEVGHTNILRPSKLQRAELSQLLERLNNEFYGADMGGTLYARGLLLQFMVEINRLAHQTVSSQPAAPKPDLVGQVLTYIGEHFAENITLDALAEVFFVSKYHLSHEFSHRVGTSVYRYVLFRRLLQARDLLAAGRQPGEVFQACGFGDYANFYRAFKAEYGVSPRDFAGIGKEHS